jgi:hypothetical protein
MQRLLVERKEWPILRPFESTDLRIVTEAAWLHAVLSKSGNNKSSSSFIQGMIWTVMP